jgi:nucleotide-binding universal stress UspA family protein
MGHIVITTDLSEESFQAFVEAQFYITGKPEIRVTLLSIIETPIFIGDPADIFVSFSDMDNILQQQEKVALQKLQDLSSTYFKGRTVETKVLQTNGNVSQSILNFAEQESAALLIIATHGRKGFRRFFLGSITESVVRSSPVPVLVVPISKELSKN